jgi:hypothetical protein
VRTIFHVDLKDAGQEFGPSHPGSFLRGCRYLSVRSGGDGLFGNLQVDGNMLSGDRED